MRQFNVEYQDMKASLQTICASVLLALSLTGTPARALAYQIDCAILLCLAGGFPPSAPCAAARAEMIRRITPWPIEPPLQLWRCPMRASIRHGDTVTQSRPVEIQYLPPLLNPPFEIQNDVDLLPIYESQIEDYLTAIKVYHLRYSRSYSSRSGNCNISARLEVGTYDRDGNFSWQRRPPISASPSWVFNTSYTQCTTVWFRGVGMEWRDHEGTKGTEVVRY